MGQTRGAFFMPFMGNNIAHSDNIWYNMSYHNKFGGATYGNAPIRKALPCLVDRGRHTGPADGGLAQRDSAAAEAVPIGDEIYLGDYNYIDVQYMTTWAYRVTLGDGHKLVFYLAEDTEGYGYLVQLSDAEYARYADIVDYTYADDSGDGAVPDDTAAPSELAVYIPLTETTAPAPVRLVGVICETPEAYIDDIAAAVGMTAEDFVYTYGDYYIDSELTPDTGSSFWSLIASFLGLAAFVLLVSAALYTAQLNSTLKQLKKGKLLERAESEFHYLEGDRRSDALVSTAFLYGRRQNIVLPLADVLWVYRHDLELMWAKRTVVELRHIDCKKWERICKEVHMSRSRVNVYYNAALDIILSNARAQKLVQEFEQRQAPEICTEKNRPS